jgi:hypothetical protein
MNRPAHLSQIGDRIAFVGMCLPRNRALTNQPQLAAGPNGLAP